jgi:uncharacterized protein YndB with AHSA1/START domain
MKELLYALNRTVLIRAKRETVFAYFTDSARWAAWWGEGSKIDPRPGGEVHIRYPGNVEVKGEVVEIAAPERIVFTYGFVSGMPVPASSTRVTIALEETRAGTRLALTHAFPDEKVRDEHVQGWRYQLAIFANLVTNAANKRADKIADAWFEAWSSTDADERRTFFEGATTEDVTFRDKYGCVDTRADLVAHVDAVHAFMPGSRIVRDGATIHCQGTFLVDWIATLADGKPAGRGTNVFELDPHGRVVAATGFWR